MVVAEQIEVFVDAPDDRWRWLYRDPEAGIELRSSTTYASAEEAVRAASGMYPAADLRVERGPSTDLEDPSKRPGLARALRSAALLAALFAWLRSRSKKPA